ncbi:MULTISPECIES: helix-turn-helix transcriptional regulator [Enterobacteriaceae]|uniref:helix-turn-helix transcriptional regulator n=1 Tax=Enterobacteriaceae TaxID=543 RepID=UPI001CEFAB45|nr:MULTISPECIES: AlpA family phage regulatory protein [Enterobacteriaceae]MCE9985262.1 AlpA family phage regulatory protein [Leclercia adecarboxylata]UGB04380.1 AlpA family phage regulatory protein [Leclercia sp. G3L]
MKNKPTMSDKVIALHQPQRLIRISAMLELLGCSRTTLYRWVKSGNFPQPLMRGGKTLGWPASLYEGWLAQNAK